MSGNADAQRPAPSPQRDECPHAMAGRSPSLVCVLPVGHDGPHTGQGAVWRTGATSYETAAPDTLYAQVIADRMSVYRKDALADDPDPKGTAALVDLLRQRGETIAKLRNAFARTGPCCCADMGEGNLDLDNLCPQHGTVAELARQLRWARHFTATIEAACPPEITEPFSGRDVAAWVAEQFTQVHPAEIRDLVRQRDTQRERAERAEDDLAALAEARLEARGEIA